MASKIVPLGEENPVDPTLQPVGWGGYQADNFWYKGPDQKWQEQIPARNCSSGWVFGTQGSDWKTPAVCTGEDSYVQKIGASCGQGYVPQETVVKQILCGTSSNSGPQCNKYSGWPNSSNPVSKNFTLVTDNNLYCVQASPAEEGLTPLQPAEEGLTPLKPAEEELTPLKPAEEELTPLKPAEEELTPLVPAEESFWSRYGILIASLAGAFGFIVLVIIIALIVRSRSKKARSYNPYQYYRRA